MTIMSRSCRLQLPLLFQAATESPAPASLSTSSGPSVLRKQAEPFQAVQRRFSGARHDAFHRQSDISRDLPDDAGRNVRIQPAQVTPGPSTSSERIVPHTAQLHQRIPSSAKALTAKGASDQRLDPPQTISLLVRNGVAVRVPFEIPRLRPRPSRAFWKVRWGGTKRALRYRPRGRSLHPPCPAKTTLRGFQLNL